MPKQGELHRYTSRGGGLSYSVVIRENQRACTGEHFNAALFNRQLQELFPSTQVRADSPADTRVLWIYDVPVSQPDADKLLELLRQKYGENTQWSLRDA